LNCYKFEFLENFIWNFADLGSNSSSTNEDSDRVVTH